MKKPRWRMKKEVHDSMYPDKPNEELDDDIDNQEYTISCLEEARDAVTNSLTVEQIKELRASE
jgi:hypothetical protein